MVFSTLVLGLAGIALALVGFLVSLVGLVVLLFLRKGIKSH
jgi:hypothetical protein